MAGTSQSNTPTKSRNNLNYVTKTTFARSTKNSKRTNKRTLSNEEYEQDGSGWIP